MKPITCAVAAACLCITPTLLWSQSRQTETSTSSSDEAASETSSSSQQAGVPLERIIAAVAKKTGKKFLIDPRVHARVQLVGQDAMGITYAELLTILQVEGLAAVEDHYYVRVIPEGGIRVSAVPLYSGKETYPDAQYVNRVLTVKNISAAQLVPILRPLVPQQGQLAAYPVTNQLLISDTFANVKKLEAVIGAIDSAAKSCEACQPKANSQRDSQE